MNIIKRLGLFIPHTHDLWKQICLGFTGIFSGAIAIWLAYSLSPNTTPSIYWLTISLTSLLWILIRQFLPRTYLLFGSMLFFIGSSIYGLYTNRSGENELADIIFLASLILAAISIIEVFLFSRYAIKIVVFILFASLLSYEVFPAIVPNFHLSYLHVFIMFLLMMLVSSFGVLIVSELIILIIQELFGKMQKDENTH